MPSKPGRPANKGSFQNGNAAAKGNMKELTLSGQLSALLKRTGDYEKDFTNAQFAAKKLFDAFAMATTPSDIRALFETLADRTEGKPQQKTDITSKGDKVSVAVISYAETEDAASDNNDTV